MTTRTAHVIGEGIFGWPAGERRTDRYGTCFVANGTWDEDTGQPEMNLDGIVGKHGKLIAVVLETRESGHIGDLFHGFFPETPEVDEKIELGEGTLFSDRIESAHLDVIGLEPDDDRNEFWLDPKKMYRCHDQTVRLEFHETPAAPEKE